MKIALIFNSLSLILISVYLFTGLQQTKIIYRDMPKPKIKPVLITVDGKPHFIGDFIDNK